MLLCAWQSVLALRLNVVIECVFHIHFQHHFVGIPCNLNTVILNNGVTSSHIMNILSCISVSQCVAVFQQCYNLQYLWFASFDPKPSNVPVTLCLPKPPWPVTLRCYKESKFLKSSYDLDVPHWRTIAFLRQGLYFNIDPTLLHAKITTNPALRVHVQIFSERLMHFYSWKHLTGMQIVTLLWNYCCSNSLCIVTRDTDPGEPAFFIRHLSSMSFKKSFCSLSPPTRVGQVVCT